MKLYWGLLLAPLAASATSCVKTGNSSQEQCRDLKTRDQQQTVGSVCVKVGDTPGTLRAVFDVSSKDLALEWARVWVGTAEEVGPLVSTPVATSVTYPSPAEDPNEISFTLEVLYQKDDPFLACPSCSDLELQVVATASVMNKQTDELVTVYGFDQDSAPLLSSIFGDKSIVLSTTTSRGNVSGPFGGFPILLTCDCDDRSTSTGLARWLRRGRQL